MTVKIDIDSVTTIVREVAEEHILPRFRNLGSGDIGYKVGDDPVTIADKEAESALSTRLSSLLPGSKTVGEEAFAANPAILESFSCESPVWLIDPIDGTRNFVEGNAEFGVIITCVQQKQLVAGWIYDPTSGEVIVAEKGGGAWHKGKRLRVLPPRPLVQASGSLGDRLVAAHRKSTFGGETHPVYETTRAGSHEYPRLVIDGPHFGKDRPQLDFRASLYFSTPWDDAAGVLIHSEAGGYSAYWNGAPYDPSAMHRGLAFASDENSWRELKAWCLRFTDLP